MSALKSKNSSPNHRESNTGSKPGFSGPESEPNNRTSLIGTVLKERYKVIKLLGSGGMGSVYLAEHVKDGTKKFAVKVPFKEYLKLIDLSVEAIAAAKIDHENIVDILDSGRTSTGDPFMVMAYYEGKLMSDFLKEEKAVGWIRAKPILLQICQGLHAAHAKGVVHHDIKPENIFLAKNGKDYTAKILDFGIAKLADGRSGLPGCIGGTPEYSAPEQSSGKESDSRADIYSLGILMYEMLTGSLPFKSSIKDDNARSEDLKMMHLIEKPPPFSALNQAIEVPDGVEAIVMRAVEKNPVDRFQSIADMMEAIVKCRSDPSLSLIELPPPPSVQRYLPRKDPVSKNFIGGILISLGIISAAFLSWQTITGGCKNNPPTRIHAKASPAKQVKIKPDSQPLKRDSGIIPVRKSKIKKSIRARLMPASQPTIESTPSPPVRKQSPDSGSNQDSLQEEESGGEDEGNSETEE